MANNVIKNGVNFIASALRGCGVAKVLLLIGSVVLLASCKEDVESKRFDFDSVNLDTGLVVEKLVSLETQFDGTVEAVNKATMSAQTAGRITQINYDVGDYVPQGSVILHITNTEQAAQMEAATSKVNEAKAMLEESLKQFERSKNIYKQKLIAKAGFDKAKADYEGAVAREKSAQAALKQAQENLKYTEVKAPYAGIVVARHVHVGETVAPGKPLMTGVSLEHLRVVVNIPQMHIGPLRKHKAARVILADRSFVAATDIRIPPSADSETHSFRVLVSLPKLEQQSVFPGTLVKVNFVSGDAKRMLMPKQALVRRGEVSGAYVVREGRVSFQYIRVGDQTIEGDYPILSGLQVGDEVALDSVAAAIAYKAQYRAQGANDEH